MDCVFECKYYGNCAWQNVDDIAPNIFSSYILSMQFHRAVEEGWGRDPSAWQVEWRRVSFSWTFEVMWGEQYNQIGGHLSPGFPCALCVKRWRVLANGQGWRVLCQGPPQSLLSCAPTIWNAIMSVFNDLHELYKKYGSSQEPILVIFMAIELNRGLLPSRSIKGHLLNNMTLVDYDPHNKRKQWYKFAGIRQQCVISCM